MITITPMTPYHIAAGIIILAGLIVLGYRARGRAETAGQRPPAEEVEALVAPPIVYIATAAPAPAGELDPETVRRVLTGEPFDD